MSDVEFQRAPHWPTTGRAIIIHPDDISEADEWNEALSEAGLRADHILTETTWSRGHTCLYDLAEERGVLATIVYRTKDDA